MRLRGLHAPNWLRPCPSIQAPGSVPGVWRRLCCASSQCDLMTEKQDPAACFERVLAVVAGERLAPYTEAQRKMITVIVSPEEADVRIGRDGLFVHYPYRRRPFNYYPDLAAPMLSALLELAPSSPPSPFRVEAAELSTIRLGAQASPRWFWIRASHDAVVVLTRYLPEGNPIPLDPPPLRMRRKLFASFKTSVTCPSCSREAVNMRLVDGWLVCLQCGRSWNPPVDLLRTARIHEAD